MIWIIIALAVALVISLIKNVRLYILLITAMKLIEKATEKLKERHK